MKKIFSYIILPVTGAIVMASCSKKIDEAYLNPNAPIRVPVEELLPAIEANMVTQYSNAGNGYGPQNDGMYIGRYVQFWATNANGNQYDQMGGATAASDILGAIWAMHYFGQGQNLNDMVKWATEEQKWDYVGVGLAIRAWAWLTLTDMHGEVILKQAFERDRRVFQYDNQQDVYEEVKRLCFAALDNLNRTDGSVSQANLQKGDSWMNNGNVNKWKKFTYAVLASVHHRTTNKADYKADSVIKYCDLAMTTNADNVTYKWANNGNTGTYSYYSSFRGNIGTFRQTRFVANLLSGANSLVTAPDPRAWYLIRENRNGTFKGIVPTKGDSTTYPATFDLAPLDRPFGFWGQGYNLSTAPSIANPDALSRYVFTNNPVWPIYSAAQMKFTKAEALYRKGLKNEALIAYTEGINLNFDQLIADYESRVPTANRITTSSRNTYLGSPSVIPTAANLTLSHIMLQKYIAMYGWGFIETWVDMRRYHYTDKENGNQVYRDFVPPTGNEIFTNNNGKLVYRARPRYNSEYLYNVAELNRIGGLALDYNTKPMWFSEP